MSTGSINNLSNSYLQSILNTTFQNTQAATTQTGDLSAIDTQSTDNGQISPFAQMLAKLQQLQQSDPTQYQQVTQQIATKLQSAAQTAQSQGNTAEADKLNQLASDFTSASQSGQLPNVQDLAQATGAGGHHHHHHSHGSSSSSSNSVLNQLLAGASTDSTTQTDSLNPMSIIFDTLSSAAL